MASNQNTQDSELVIWSILIFSGMVVALFYFQPGLLLGPWHAVKLVEVKLISLLSPVLPESKAAIIASIDRHLSNNPLGSATWSAWWKIESALLPVTGWVYGLIIGFLGYKIATRPRFTMRHDMDSLIDIHTRVPAFRFNRLFFNKYNPSRDDLDPRKGPFRLPYKGKEVAKVYKLIRKARDGSLEIDESRLITVLKNQLGRLYEGTHHLSKDELAIMAICLLRINHRMEEATALLGDLGYLYAGELREESVRKTIDKVIASYSNDKTLRRLTKRHAYVNTLLCALFEEAKQSGKLTNSMVKWLQIENSTLYFALYDVWRPNATAESIAIRSHLEMEKAVGRALREPQLESAIVGLRGDLIKDHILPIPEDALS